MNLNTATLSAPSSVIDFSRFGTITLVIAVHAALLLAIWSAKSTTEPTVEAPTLAFVELPVVQPEKPAAPPKPQAKPQPKVEKAQPKPVPKPLPKPPVELPKSETAPVVPQETAKPRPEVKEVAAPVAKAAPAKPEPAAEAPSQPSVQAGYMSMPRSYPRQSQLLGEEGTVVVTVMVNEEGKPLSSALFTSSGFERLDQDALRTVMKWRFNPAKKEGKAIALSVNVPVKYSLNKAS